MEVILLIFCCLAVCLGSYTRVQAMNFSWLVKYFKKQKWRTKSNLKRYKSEKNIKNYVGKCKSLRGKEEKQCFYGRSNQSKKYFS